MVADSADIGTVVDEVAEGASVESIKVGNGDKLGSVVGSAVGIAVSWDIGEDWGVELGVGGIVVGETVGVTEVSGVGEDEVGVGVISSREPKDSWARTIEIAGFDENITDNRQQITRNCELRTANCELFLIVSI